MYDIQVTPAKENDMYVSENNDVTYTYDLTNNCEFDVLALKLAVETSDNFKVESLTVTTDEESKMIGNAKDLNNEKLFQENQIAYQLMLKETYLEKQ